MKKVLVIMFALALSLTFTACSRGNDLGDKINSGMDRVSEGVSEGISNAGDMIRDGVTNVSEGLSNVGDAIRDGSSDATEIMGETTSGANGTNGSSGSGSGNSGSGSGSGAGN